MNFVQKNRTWVIPLVMVKVCALSLALFLWHKHKKENDLYVASARKYHMDVDTFKKVIKLMDKAELEHNLIAKDWAYLEHCFYSTDNPEAQGLVLTDMCRATIPPQHRTEVLRMTHQYLNQYPQEHNPIAVHILYRLNDPSCKLEALHALQEPNPRMRDIIELYFKQYGLLSQLPEQGDLGNGVTTLP